MVDGFLSAGTKARARVNAATGAIRGRYFIQLIGLTSGDPSLIESLQNAKDKLRMGLVRSSPFVTQLSRGAGEESKVQPPLSDYGATRRPSAFEESYGLTRSPKSASGAQNNSAPANEK